MLHNGKRKRMLLQFKKACTISMRRWPLSWITDFRSVAMTLLPVWKERFCIRTIYRGKGSEARSERKSAFCLLVSLRNTNGKLSVYVGLVNVLDDKSMQFRLRLWQFSLWQTWKETSTLMRVDCLTGNWKWDIGF